MLRWNRSTCDLMRSLALGDACSAIRPSWPAGIGEIGERFARPGRTPCRCSASRAPSPRLPCIEIRHHGGGHSRISWCRRIGADRGIGRLVERDAAGDAAGPWRSTSWPASRAEELRLDELVDEIVHLRGGDGCRRRDRSA